MPNPDSGMYDDAPDSASAPKADQNPEESDDSQTAILPRSFFGGKDIKPGDKCDVTVKAVHEGDVEVEPCEGHDDEDQEAPKQSDAPAAEGSMASMME